MAGVLVVLAAGDGGTAEECPDWDWPLGTLEPGDHAVDVRCIEYSVGAPADPAGRSGRPGSTAVAPVRTWEILPLLHEPSIVHVCGPYTPAGETAVLAAKLLGRKIVLSGFSRRASAIGESLGLSDLADGIICRSDEEAAAFAGHRLLRVLDLGAGAAVRPALDALYGQLVAEAEGPR